MKIEYDNSRHGKIKTDVNEWLREKLAEGNLENQMSKARQLLSLVAADWLESHPEKLDCLADLIDSVSCAIVTSLMETMSLRQIARKMKRSPTYLSMVLNRRAYISEEFYLELVNLAYPQETSAATTESKPES